MKIPNIENKKNVIYIQLKDLYAIIDIVKNVPIEIKSIIENNINTNLKENDFIRLESPNIIDFFNSIDWILNYKEFVKSKPYEIEYQYMRTHQRLMLFKPALKQIPEDYCSIEEYKKSNHKMNDIKQAINSIVHNDIYIPLVEDSEAQIFYLEQHQNYKIQSSLNPNVFLLRNLNQSCVSLESINYSELKEFFKLIKNLDCDINLELYSKDTSLIICTVTPIKEKVMPKKKRFFFNKKKKY